MQLKTSIEYKAYEEFKKLQAAGKFHNQRLGQAFYNHFNLHKSTVLKDQLDRLYLFKLYQLDGKEAEDLIFQIFQFN